MRKSTLPDNNVIVAYWLNAELTNTFACPTAARRLPASSRRTAVHRRLT